MRHPQHRLDRLAGGGFIGRVVDVDKIVVRYHLLDRKTPGHDVIDQQGDELLRYAVALDDAAHGAPVLQEGRLERDFGALARAAEQHAGAGRHQAIDRLAEHRRQRRRLQRVARAEAGDLPDLLNHVGAARVVDRVRRAELARQVELPGVEAVIKENGKLLFRQKNIENIE